MKVKMIFGNEHKLKGKAYYQVLRKRSTHKIKGYLALNIYAQRIAYRFRYIAAVDMQTITISL